MKILKETTRLLLAQPDDGVRALGEMALLASYTRQFTVQPLGLLMDQFRAAIEAELFGIVYRWNAKSKDFVVPVGFFTWGFLSEPCTAIHANDLRMLTAPELKSGEHWRVIFGVFPYSGYFDDGLDMLWQCYPQKRRFGFMKLKDGNEKLHYLNNPYFKGA